MSKDDVCRHCGGKLQRICLPDVIYVTEKPPKIRDYSVARICSKCGRVHEGEAVKRIPRLEDLQRETDLRRIRREE